MLERMCRVIGVHPDGIAQYKELHAHPWPEITEALKAQNIQNFSIFLREPENLLFSYWEYTGTDFADDRAKAVDTALTKRWWALTAPLQAPLDSREEGEWWAPMEQVFFCD